MTVLKIGYIEFSEIVLLAVVRNEFNRCWYDYRRNGNHEQYKKFQDDTNVINDLVIYKTRFFWTVQFLI